MYTIYLNSLLQKSQEEICVWKLKSKKKAIGYILFYKQKVTDKNNLLQTDSFHAPQTFRRIPKGQFTWARRICSDNVEYRQNMIMLVDRFSARGYDRKELIRVGNEISDKTEMR